MNNTKSLWHLCAIQKDAFFNAKNKLYLWFLNTFIAKEDEFYGFDEPPQEWMRLHNKKFWIQPINMDEEEVMK